ncbi:hypothetical protein [Pseudomonas canadensis]|uniref:hypothetical protein n=1 Tax=Pseudomonas canadensis TaxID=915099 RepID=UPI003B9F2762
MIIVINDFANLEIDRQLKLRVIDNLLRAYGEARHIAWMPLELVNTLKESDYFSEFSKRIIIDLLSFVREGKYLSQELEFHLEIDFSDGYSSQVVLPDKIKIGYKNLIDSTQFNSPFLLVENLLDSEIIQYGAESYLCSRKMLSNFKINLSPINGGGSTTYDVFRTLKGTPGFTLCMLDSDRRHPNAAVGDTAGRFRDEQTNAPKHFIKILDCTELENIIPFKIMQTALEKNNSAVLPFFNRLTPAVREFLDHKQGMTVKQALEYDKAHAQTFWGKILAEGYSEDDVVCPPLGDKIASHCSNLLSQLTTQKINEVVSENTNTHWINLGKLAASWGISKRRGVS